MDKMDIKERNRTREKRKRRNSLRVEKADFAKISNK